MRFSSEPWKKRGDEGKTLRVSTTVVGLDLSLRLAAAVALPSSWDPASDARWDVPNLRVGGELDQYDGSAAERVNSIVDAVTLFVIKHGGHSPRVFVENYAFSRQGTGSASLVVELGGALKFWLRRRTGVEVASVNDNTARKFFLGKLPAKNRAAATHEMLKKIGCPWPESDRGDAWVIANYGRSECGLAGVSCPA